MKTKYNTIAIEDLGKEVNAILRQYSLEMEKEMENVIKEEGKKAQQYIKEYYKSINIDTSTKTSRKKYINCFRTKSLGKYARELRNTKYQLSHLLESGHKSANQYGKNYAIKRSKYGTKGKKTIAYKMWDKTTEYVEDDFPKMVKERALKVKL